MNIELIVTRPLDAGPCSVLTCKDFTCVYEALAEAASYARYGRYVSAVYVNEKYAWSSDLFPDATKKVAKQCCEHCEQMPGEVGHHAPDDEPLGELERCSACGQMVCPVCLHEADCCFSTDDFRDRLADDSNYAPPGWIIVGGTYERVEENL